LDTARENVAAFIAMPDRACRIAVPWARDPSGRGEVRDLTAVALTATTALKQSAAYAGNLPTRTADDEPGA
jgi:hypothetical protein